MFTAAMCPHQVAARNGRAFFNQKLTVSLKAHAQEHAEIAVLPLFATRINWRACALQLFNGASNPIFSARSEVGVLTFAFRDPLDKINGPCDTADWLDGYGERRRLGHNCRPTAGNLAHFRE